MFLQTVETGLISRDTPNMSQHLKHSPEPLRYQPTIPYSFYDTSETNELGCAIEKFVCLQSLGFRLCTSMLMLNRSINLIMRKMNFWYSRATWRLAKLTTDHVKYCLFDYDLAMVLDPLVRRLPPSNQAWDSCSGIPWTRVRERPSTTTIRMLMLLVVWIICSRITSM